MTLLPRVELVLRDRQSWWQRPLATACGLVAGVLLSALLLELFGVPSAAVFSTVLEGGFFGGVYALSDTLTKAVPVVLCGLACAVAFRANLWNVGAEGQLLLGAWAATGMASAWLPAETPAWLMLPAMALAGAAAGAAWGLVPGLLRAKLHVSEILTSLMLVYVAAQFNNLFIFSIWSDRGFQMTPLFPKCAWLPRLSDLAEGIPALAGLTLHVGLLVALLAAVLLWLLMYRSRLGFEIKVAGLSPKTAAYAGMPVTRNIVLVMALSGALAGLAGMCEVSGVVHRLQERFSPGFGFTGIIVAWLGGLHPAGIVLVSFLLSGLLVGARQVQPSGIAMMLQGVLLACVIAAELFGRYRIVVRVGGGP